jgi:hypothetical protein
MPRGTVATAAGETVSDRCRSDTVVVSADCLVADVVALVIVGRGIDHAPHLRLVAPQKNHGVLLEADYDIRTIQELLGHQDMPRR